MGNHTSDSAVTDFLDDVTDQISYHPLRPSVRQELEDHIQDRIEEYEAEGFSSDDAQCRAIKGMGDAVTIGTELNETHKLQKAPLLTLVTVLLLLTGLAFSSYMQWSPEQSANGFLYYITGGIILALTVWKGYPLLIRYRKILALLIGLLYLLQIVCVKFTYIRFILFGKIKLPYYITILLTVVIAVLLYNARRNRKRSLAAAIVCAIVWLLFIYSTNWFTTKAAILIFLLSMFGTICFMIHRGILSGRKISLYSGAFISLIVFGSPLLLSESNMYNVKAFLTPQSAVHGTWDDTYNAVLIQELLAKTPLTHGLSLTPEQMMDYGTGAWYFASRNPGQIGVDASGIKTDEQWDAFHEKVDALKAQGYRPQYIHYTAEDVTLWDILPQHYHNNYLIAVCIFMFGWLPGLILPGGILLFYLLLFYCITRIRGPLSSTIAFSCAQCLLWQGILYILGNFGYQYNMFTNLPLISEGRISIIFNMLLLGMIISAYRYDRIIQDPVNLKPQTT